MSFLQMEMETPEKRPLTLSAPFSTTAGPPLRAPRSVAMPAYRQQLLERTRSCLRAFCVGLLGFISVLLLCLSPLPWVQFTVLKDQKRLWAGLWTLCHSDLCWSHPVSALQILEPPPLVSLLRGPAAHHFPSPSPQPRPFFSPVIDKQGQLLQTG